MSCLHPFVRQLIDFPLPPSSVNILVPSQALGKTISHHSSRVTGMAPSSKVVSVPSKKNPTTFTFCLLFSHLRQIRKCICNPTILSLVLVFYQFVLHILYVNCLKRLTAIRRFCSSQDFQLFGLRTITGCYFYNGNALQ